MTDGGPELVWSTLAIEDLRAAREYVTESGDPTAARALANRIRHRVEELPRHPQIGRVVPEFATPRLREVIVAPYRIVYLVDDAAHRVVIVRIWHGRRDLPRVDLHGE